MRVIRRINPASAFKVGMIVNGLMGLVLGLFCTVASIAGAAFVRQAHIALYGATGTYVGYFAVILCPILYGFLGGIGGAIIAFIYNLASQWIGGLEVDLT